MSIQQVISDKLQALLDGIAWAFNAFMTMWRLAIYWINRGLLYMEYGGKRRTDFYHKVSNT